MSSTLHATIETRSPHPVWFCCWCLCTLLLCRWE